MRRNELKLWVSFGVVCLDGSFGCTPLSCRLARVSRHTSAMTARKQSLHVPNYFSSLWAVFSSGPQKGVQTVSWEMVTSSAQILRQEFSPPSCSFVLVPMHRYLQHPTSQQSRAQEPTGRMRSNPSATHKNKPTYPKSKVLYRNDFLISVLINPNKNWPPVYSFTGRHL